MTKEEIVKRFCKFELCTHRNGEGTCCLYNQDNCIFHRLEKENAELKADNDARKFAMAISEKVEKQLREQIEKMKRHCNCKHRDSEGYCEVKRTYLMDLSYDGCDKWELED